MLHDDWWMAVLRPNSVSIGCTDRQLDSTPQSPQPSHTRSLITMRSGGSQTRPRLRSRRFSAAHCWSWMRTVTPFDAGERLLGLDDPVAVPHLDAAGQADALVLLAVVGGDDHPVHAFERGATRSGSGIGMAPAASWPPVMATAPL